RRSIWPRSRRPLRTPGNLLSRRLAKGSMSVLETLRNRRRGFALRCAVFGEALVDLLKIARNAEEILTGTFLVVMSLATLANVVARYVFGAPIPWAEELSRYSFVWLVFLGAAVCSKHGRHVAIDALVNAMPPRGKAASRVAVDLLTAGLMIALVYYGG